MEEWFPDEGNKFTRIVHTDLKGRRQSEAFEILELLNQVQCTLPQNTCHQDTSIAIVDVHLTIPIQLPS